MHARNIQTWHGGIVCQEHRGSVQLCAVRPIVCYTRLG